MIDRILERANIKRLSVWTIITLIFATCIVTLFFGRLQVVEEATLDSLNYYTADTFFSYLELQGEVGRTNYLYLHIFDYLFMISFALLLMTALAMLVKGKTMKKNPGAFRFIILLPILSLCADFIENICIDVSLMAFPRKVDLLANIAGSATFVKMNVITANLIIICALALWNVLLFFRRRN